MYPFVTALYTLIDSTFYWSLYISLFLQTPLMTLSGHTDGVSGVQWTDTSEIATCGLDCTLRIWDVELGGLKHQLVLILFDYFLQVYY